MKHVLVIGGSGMLAKASCWLASHVEQVSVVGRSQHRLNRLVEMYPNVNPIAVDYYDHEQFRKKIRQSMADNGRFELVVAWIHNQEKQILGIVSEEIHRISKDSWQLYHILGSSSNLQDILKEMNVEEPCEYHQIQLGFVIENGRSRWLTHEEISDGVIQGIQSRAKKHLVGTLTPWSRRP